MSKRKLKRHIIAHGTLQYDEYEEQWGVIRMINMGYLMMSKAKKVDGKVGKLVFETEE